jgi:hypothetical protein
MTPPTGPLGSAGIADVAFSVATIVPALIAGSRTGAVLATIAVLALLGLVGPVGRTPNRRGGQTGNRVDLFARIRRDARVEHLVTRTLARKHGIPPRPTPGRQLVKGELAKD